jgi:hypothetical protein
MLIIFDKETMKETQKIITDGIKQVSLSDNEISYYVKNDTELANLIQSAHEYSPVIVKNKLIDVTVTKTKKQHIEEIENSPDTIKRKTKELIIKQLEESDKQILKIVDDLMEFCETLGYKPNKSKKDLLQARKQLRQELQGLDN